MYYDKNYSPKSRFFQEYVQREQRQQQQRLEKPSVDGNSTMTAPDYSQTRQGNQKQPGYRKVRRPYKKSRYKQNKFMRNRLNFAENCLPHADHDLSSENKLCLQKLPSADPLAFYYGGAQKTRFSMEERVIFERMWRGAMCQTFGGGKGAAKQSPHDHLVAKKSCCCHCQCGTVDAAKTDVLQGYDTKSMRSVVR